MICDHGYIRIIIAEPSLSKRLHRLFQQNRHKPDDYSASKSADIFHFAPYIICMAVQMMYGLTMLVQPAFPEICIAALMQHARPDMFKALCDPVRISIVATLAARRSPATVSQIAECCGIDFSGVSRHLKILHDVGILSAKKQGREKLYSVEIEHLADSLRSYASALEMCGSPLTQN